MTTRVSNWQDDRKRRTGGSAPHDRPRVGVAASEIPQLAGESASLRDDPVE